MSLLLHPCILPTVHHSRHCCTAKLWCTPWLDSFEMPTSQWVRGWNHLPTRGRKSYRNWRTTWPSNWPNLDAFHADHLDGHQIAWTLKDFFHFFLGFIREKLISRLLHHALAYFADAVIIFSNNLPLPDCLNAVFCRPAGFGICNTLTPITWTFSTLVDWRGQVTSRDDNHTSDTWQQP